jgi:hypothetical protein
MNTMNKMKTVIKCISNRIYQAKERICEHFNK